MTRREAIERKRCQWGISQHAHPAPGTILREEVCGAPAARGRPWCTEHEARVDGGTRVASRPRTGMNW